MKYIEVTEDWVIFCGGKRVIVYQKGSCEDKILSLPVPTSTKPASEVKAVCLKLSQDLKYLAVACDSKAVSVWDTQKWTIQSTHKLIKRPMSIDITSDCNNLLVADKTGDVYHFPLKGASTSDDESNKEETSDEERAERESLLGHLSMLLDLAVTHDNKYVITCDRDEKIRVSHYPNAYNIESFCLGHTEFVSQIHLLPGKDPLLLSCSGDGSIKLWNYLSGNCLSTAMTQEQTASYQHHFEEYCQQKVKDSEEAKRFLPDHPAVKNFSIQTREDGCSLVAAVIDRLPAIFLYKIEDNKLQYVSTTDMKTTVPRVVTWITSGELLVEQNNDDKPISVFKLQLDQLTALDAHPLIDFGQRHKQEFIDGKNEICVDILYKQRYDNVADYLKKKQERLETEKAVEAGLIQPVKKGRWL